MLKNCSGCGGRHVWPFGSQCVYIKGLEMADGSKPYKDRDDPAYLTYLEDQLTAACARSAKDSHSITSLIARMDRLEVSGPFHAGDNTSPDGATGGAGSGLTAGRPGVGLGLHGSPTGQQPPPGPGAGSGVGLLDVGIPADVISGPLTSALRQLSQAIDPSRSANKGIRFRPEYYIQHVDKGTQVKSLDHSKITFRELISGMGRVMQYILETNGDLAGYVGHFNFIAEQAHQHSFIDQAYVCYDRFVVDKYIKLDHLPFDQRKFSVGDVLGVSSHFNAGNLQLQHRQQSFQRGGRFSKSRRSFDSAQETDKSKKEFTVPEGFPEEICYAWNYKSCSGKCSKKHECRVCGADHKAVGCQSKSKKQ